MAKGTIQIDLLGTSFSINANEDSEYLNKILGYYKRIVENVSKNSTLQNNLQTAILSGIMLCDELFKEKSKNVKFKNALEGKSTQEEEKVFQKMLKDLEEVL